MMAVLAIEFRRIENNNGEGTPVQCIVVAPCRHTVKFTDSGYIPHFLVGRGVMRLYMTYRCVSSSDGGSSRREKAKRDFPKSLSEAPRW